MIRKQSPVSRNARLLSHAEEKWRPRLTWHRELALLGLRKKSLNFCRRFTAVTAALWLPLTLMKLVSLLVTFRHSPSCTLPSDFSSSAYPRGQYLATDGSVVSAFFRKLWRVTVAFITFSAFFGCNCIGLREILQRDARIPNEFSITRRARDSR